MKLAIRHAMSEDGRVILVRLGNQVPDDHPAVAVDPRAFRSIPDEPTPVVKPEQQPSVLRRWVDLFRS